MALEKPFLLTSLILYCYLFPLYSSHRSHRYHNHAGIPPPPSNYNYNFEQHLSSHKRLDPSCAMIIISETFINFEPITSHPFMIISNQTKDFDLFHTRCIILILPEFIGITHTIEHVLWEKFELVQLVLAYPVSEEYADIRKVRDLLKMEVVMINKMTGTTRKYEAINDICKGNIKCILKRRVLRIGYTSGMSLEAKAWKYYNSINQSMPTIILNRSNPVFNHFSSLEAHFLHLLVDTYEMTLVMIAPSDYKYGELNENGSWIGKLGLLSRNEVDCLIPATTANTELKQLGEFLTSMRIVKFVLVSKRNVNRKDNWNSLLLSFDLPMWSFIIGSFLIVCPSAWLATKIHNRIIGVDLIKEENILHISAWAYTAIVAKPMRRSVNGPATFILGSWLICCLILQCYYISNFMAKLSAPDDEITLDTLQDVWEQKKQLILVRGRTLSIFFKESRDEQLQNLYKSRITPKSDPISHDEYVQLLDDGYVGVAPEWPLKYFIYNRTNPQDYYISSNPILTMFSSWIFGEDDSLIGKAINSLILEVAASGHFQRWEEISEPSLMKKVKSNPKIRQLINLEPTNDKTISIALHHFQGVFLFWILGLCISIIISVIEKISISQQIMQNEERSRNGQPQNPIIFVLPYMR